MDDNFKGWARRGPISFYFNPEINAVTMSVSNEFYDIKPMKLCEVYKVQHVYYIIFNFKKVKRKDIDRSQPNSSLLYLHFKIMPKAQMRKPADLKITFEGTKQESFMVISSDELLQFQLGNKLIDFKCRALVNVISKSASKVCI